MSLLSLPPLVVWGLLPRLVGAVFLVSFLSLASQVVAIAGREGAIPFRSRVEAYRRALPPWRLWTCFPSLLLLHDGDRFLRALVWLGVAGAVGMIYGGAWALPGLLCCYVVYISLDKPIGLIFPWDCLLYESAFLCLLLPRWQALPAIEAVEAPNPLVVWCFRLLIVRVLLGFGKLKFIGSSREDSAYLYGFLVNQPLPSPLGWLLQKAPLPALQAAMLFMFIVEMPLPLLAFSPRWGAVVGLLTVPLMIGIGLCGTFGYFNVLVVALCPALWDTVTPARLWDSGWIQSGALSATSAVAALQLLGGALAFPFNSWVGQHWHHWPILLRLPRALRLPFDFYRALHPLRWVHPYGVFPPKSQPAAKVTPVVEVSWNGRDWEELEYPLACSTPRCRPRFIAPHHARGDQAVIYEAFGLNSQSLINGLTCPGDPFAFSDRSIAEALLQRLLEGRHYPGVYFKRNAKITPDNPPEWARIRTFLLEPTDLAERRRTGRWWRRRYIGPHLPARRREPHFWDHWLPPPELFHWEHALWRKRTKLACIEKAARAGVPSDELVRLGTTDLDDRVLRRFWDEFIPEVGPLERFASAEVAALRARLAARFLPEELRSFARVLGRLCWAAMASVEPLYCGRLRPALRATSYGHLWLGVHEIILRGEAAYEQLRSAPLSAAASLTHVEVERGLWLSLAVRPDAYLFEARKLRLIDCFIHDYRAPVGPIERRRFERQQALARRLTVFADVADAIKRLDAAPFDTERYPRFVLTQRGRVVARAPDAEPVFESNVVSRGRPPRSSIGVARAPRPDRPRRARA